MMKAVAYIVRSQTLSYILSLNATILKPFIIKLLIDFLQNLTALFLQCLMKYYSEQIFKILYGIMSLNLITVYYLLSTTYTTRKCIIKLAILLNLC